MLTPVDAGKISVPSSKIVMVSALLSYSIRISELPGAVNVVKMLAVGFPLKTSPFPRLIPYILELPVVFVWFPFCIIPIKPNVPDDF